MSDEQVEAEVAKRVAEKDQQLAQQRDQENLAAVLKQCRQLSEESRMKVVEALGTPRLVSGMSKRRAIQAVNTHDVAGKLVVLKLPAGVELDPKIAGDLSAVAEVAAKLGAEVIALEERFELEVLTDEMLASVGLQRVPSE